MMKLGRLMKFSQDGPNIAVMEGIEVEWNMRKDHIWIDVRRTNS